MGAKKPRRYTAGQRLEALELAAQIGIGKAAGQLGIPAGTVSCWKFQAGQQAVAKVKDSGGVEGAAGRATQRDTRPIEQPRSESKATTGRRVRRLYTPSERAQILAYADEHGITKAKEQFRCSRWSIRDWRRKVALHAKGDTDKSPVVGSDDDPAAKRDRRILAIWRKHPGLGPSQIRNQLRRDGLKVSVHTVRCTMEEHGYLPPKSRRKEVHDERYEAIRPNLIWHADFLHRYINKLPVYVLLLIDDFSRFIVGWAVWDAERVSGVIETFETAVSRHGRPESMMSDGGSAFWAWRGVGQFTRLLEEYDVDQLIAKTPQVNGKLEILNSNIQKELFNVDRFFDLAETRNRLEAWVEFYNFRRTHHGLGGLLVPADRYFGRADRVLAAIEAGRSAEGIGEPAPVSARLLDLLRVSSRGGQVEVTLMGSRIWPT